MPYFTTSKIVEEELPWETYIPNNCTKLIVGTFPTTSKRRYFQFFYPNPNNYFWEVLSKITDIKLRYSEGEYAVNERKKILDKLNLGITDMGSRIYRHQDSSLDQNIFPVEFMNIFQILDENPRINTIILTSTTGSNSAEGWLRSYCKLNGIKLAKLQGKNPKTIQLKYSNKVIKVTSVHSTSKATFKNISALIPMYKECLLIN